MRRALSRLPVSWALPPMMTRRLQGFLMRPQRPQRAQLRPLRHQLQHQPLRQPRLQQPLRLRLRRHQQQISSARRKGSAAAVPKLDSLHPW